MSEWVQPAGDRLHDPDRLGVLDHDVLHVQCVAPFECSNVRFYPTQAFLFLSHGLFELCPTQTQHPTELVDRGIIRKHFSDLFQTEAQFAERDDPVQRAQLAHAVQAVATGAVNPLGLEQPKLVVVTEHTRGDLPQASELSDVQHDKTIDRP